MRYPECLIAAAGICLVVAPVVAAESRQYDIPDGPLGSALVLFGRQAGLTIGVTDSAVAIRRSKGVRGQYSTREALRRLLAGTDAIFVFVDAQTVRIESSSPPRRTRRPEGAASPPPSASVETIGDQEIIVTASKQSTPLDRYAGSVDILDLEADRNARGAARGTASILARLPVLASTSLGPGRDKLFIRGVADSSFNGPSQATVGQYLGDVRLTYNAPDPDLNLYDIVRVEVLEGPQGTLYGTGSLGGIIRLVPSAPDAGDLAASMTGGGIATEHGGTGGDIAAMVNVPLAEDRLALRGVGYLTVDPGYIDDPARGLNNVNRTKTYGGRATLRYQPGDRWTIDVGGVLQNIVSRDGQYTLRGRPKLTRETLIAQPFDNDYRLAHVSIGKSWSGITLASTTAIVRQNVGITYDATVGPDTTSALGFEEDISITLISHETRLSGGGGRRSWVAGLSGVSDVSRLTRRLGDPQDPTPIAGVRNKNSELASFGQYSLPVFTNVTATVGGRLVFARTAGTLLDESNGEPPEPSRSAFRVLPMAALAWQMSGRLLGFVHYQQGFRAGGLAVAPSGSADESRVFTGDSILMGEAGLRFGQRGSDTFSASGAASFSRWSDIQADLVDDTGLPFTTNVGDGQIYGFQAQMTWVPAPGLTLEASMFLNRSRLNSPEPDFASENPDFAAAENFELPNIAGTGAWAAFSYRTTLSPSSELTLDGALRYVGKSQLGFGAPLDVAQGDYLEASLGARLALGRFGLSVDISNLADVRGNRFAFGNPFGIAARDQVTPLRPRSIRLGVDTRF